MPSPSPVLCDACRCILGRGERWWGQKHRRSSSSWWGKGGVVHDHVVGVSLVVPVKRSEEYVKTIELGTNDPLLRAAKVKFLLERGFKRSVMYDFTDDARIKDVYADHATKHEFADITWYPSRHTTVYRYDDRVPLNMSGYGKFDFLRFQSNSVQISKSVRATSNKVRSCSLRCSLCSKNGRMTKSCESFEEKSLENARSVNGKCSVASTTLGYKKLIANRLKNGLIFTGYPVIGRQGKMQTSGSCLYLPPSKTDLTCVWVPRIDRLFFYKKTAIFPAKKFGDFVRYVKKLRDMNPENFCRADIYNGFLIRFRASEAYLGQPEDFVVVDFNYYRPDEPTTPRLKQDVWEEVEQMAFFKYGAKPHRVKNRKVALHGVNQKYPDFNKFIATKKQLDP